MLRSPAFWALSLTAHRILDRLEIEHASHAGRDNGRLPVTFADFAEYVKTSDRHTIAPAISEVVRAGLHRGDKTRARRQWHLSQRQFVSPDVSADQRQGADRRMACDRNRRAGRADRPPGHAKSLGRKIHFASDGKRHWASDGNRTTNTSDGNRTTRKNSTKSPVTETYTTI